MTMPHRSHESAEKRPFARKLTVASFATALAATLGGAAFLPTQATAAPDTELPVAINEVESNGDDTDWVEFGNPTGDAVDLTGYIFTDNEPTKAGHTYVLPEGSVVPSNGYFVLDQAQGPTPGFDFGLGKNDSVNLYAPPAEGETVEDAIAKEPVLSYEWTGHADVTYGRCPDFTGDLIDTFASTKGGPNQCEELPEEPGDPGDPNDPLNPVPWPGGQTVKPLHDADDARGDWSGLYWQAAGTFGSGKPYLWVAENGNGTLLRLDGTEENRGAELQKFTLKYADGTGTPDAESVTRAAGAPSKIFVGTERDNDNKKDSRPAVLAFDAPDTAAENGELKATHEWNLAKDFPGLGANSGIEGLSWIPDAWLVENKIQDEATGKAYDPAAYPAHHGGVFAVGIEGTGHVYLYVLNEDGSFQRIADIETGLDVVAEVQFDAERDQLWAICDDACEGRIAVLTPEYGEDAGAETATMKSASAESAGKLTVAQVMNRPSETQNYANEGVAIADISQCKDGSVPVFYADDNNTDDISLREGTLKTICPTPPPGDEPTPVPTENPAPTEDPTPAPTEDPAPGEEPTADPTDAAPSGEAPTTPAPGVDAGSSTSGGNLANTGADVASWITLAAAAMVLGGAATLAVRRNGGAREEN